MAKQQNPVANLYQTVIDDVINNVRESFLDDGVDEQVLQELKQIWESKLTQTKAVDSPVLGDRSGRPPLYTYLRQPAQQTAGQSVVYQAIPAQTIQLSGASQQARLSLSDVVYQQQDGSIMLPTQSQQIFTAYQPVTVLPQSTIQITNQQRTAGGSGQPIVLASATQSSVAQQQQVAGKQQPSTIIQVDGSNEDSFNVNDPSRSETCCKSTLSKVSNVKIRSDKKKTKAKFIMQIDGGNDSSSSEDVDDDDNDDDEDDDDEEDDEEDDESKEEEKQDEEPLCSDDDDSDQDPDELFDTDNVVVCQYDKIHRAKAKWKFNLKVGIMNLKGKDQVFQKALGEADW